MNCFVIALSCVFLTLIISKVTVVGTVLGAILLFLQVAAYFCTAFVNPGIPDRNLVNVPEVKMDPKYAR